MMTRGCMTQAKSLACVVEGNSHTGTSRQKVVAHAGFEPAISALRGRRPSPLDECAIAWLGILDSNQGYLIQSQASYR